MHGDSKAARQAGGLAERRNQLRIHIWVWEQLLPLYMPGLLQYQASLCSSSATLKVADNPEDIKLQLPSRLPSDKRSQICIQGLSSIEEKLRTAQCWDALETIQNMLKIKSCLVAFKNKNIRGQ